MYLPECLMIVSIFCLFLCGPGAFAAPASFTFSWDHGLRRWWKEKSQIWMDPEYLLQEKLVLPQRDVDSFIRKGEVDLHRQGYLYGPSLLGNISFFPTGPLGNPMVQQHQDTWYADAAWLTDMVNKEIVTALATLERAGGLRNLDDYRILYDGLWPDSIPGGPAIGVLSNGTSDLLFAMERLSVSPYAVRRLHPTVDQLPFTVDHETVRVIAGTDLDSLHRQGRLFLVDHSYQKAYPTVKSRYVAACQAYFYLDPKRHDFLPLAIQTNVGSNLTYTPLDDGNDWLLAKIMFNQNDLFYGQIYHLANSHGVAEIVHQAALRTMGSNHPVLALLNRIMYQAYAIRPVGEAVLFNDGGFFDQVFAITNHGVRLFATEAYWTVAGAFRSNYFHADLVKRGLLNSTYGPPLTSFPFLEDGDRLFALIRSFMADFVQAYYESDYDLAQDYELQDWIAEANDAALVVDFPPSPLVQAETLVDILTHMAFLTGVSHHVLNAGEPATTSGVLPLHPAALYAPIPTTKGVHDLMPFLPPAQEAVEQIALLARFNRPQLVEKQQTLQYMFNDAKLLSRAHPQVRAANAKFIRAMQETAEIMAKRKFDQNGLSQGMPFIWTGLDPSRVPFFLST